MTLEFNHFILSEKEANNVSNETGKRYFCSKCNAEFVITRGGDGAVMCCGQPMAQK